MKYKYEQFEHVCELVDFLNKNNIEKENIVSIRSDRYFNHLIYIVAK